MSTKGSQNGEAMSVPSQIGNDIAINSWKLEIKQTGMLTYKNALSECFREQFNKLLVQWGHPAH